MGLDPGTYSIVIAGATTGEQTFDDAFEVTATVAFNPTSGSVLTEVAVTGTGWVADEVIDPDSVTVGVAEATHTLVVDVGGNLSGTITVPTGLDPGTHSIVITGATSGEQAFVNAFEVTT
jgi:hypothetical protein